MLDAFRHGYFGEPHEFHWRIGDARGAGARFNGHPNRARKLYRQFVELQRRDKADNALRDQLACLGKAMRRFGVVAGKLIETPCKAGDAAAADQTRHRFLCNTGGHEFAEAQNAARFEHLQGVICLAGLHGHSVM